MPLRGTFYCSFASVKFLLQPEKSSLVFRVLQTLVFVCEDFFAPSTPVDTDGNRKESTVSVAVQGCCGMGGVGEYSVFSV